MILNSYITVLVEIYTSFSSYVKYVIFSLDPRQWNEVSVAAWLRWAAREFSLEGVALHQFARAQGKDICAMGREAFVARTPAFMGDILWEHLEILQKGKNICRFDEIYTNK